MKTILIADDEDSLRVILKDSLKDLADHFVFANNGDEALQILKSQNIDVALLDIRMPGLTGLDILKEKSNFYAPTSCIVMTAQDTMENAVDAMKLGAFDYITKPFDIFEVKTLVSDALKNKSQKLVKTSLTNKKLSEKIIGKTKAMQNIFKTIGRVAAKNVTVLIQGESGTGKELIAKALHQNSPRSENPFVAVNCSAIPHEILESELFGHKKGSFTGAIADKIGYFDKAHNGTIFLDEIGDMPLILQTKILRFLQDHTIQKVGSPETKVLNVRVIAATNRDLKKEISNGHFREDLFFRLNVVPIDVPPLRERKDDIPQLLDYFLKKHSQNYLTEYKELTPEACQYLIACDWPGNIRELENTIRRLIVLSRGPQITKNEVLKILQTSTQLPKKSIDDFISEEIKNWLAQMESPQNLYDEFLPKFEAPLLKKVLTMTDGNQIKAAEILGIHRNTLRKKLKDLKIQ